jgi:photosystem II stability/assembly factor-like uncharacterized protein
MHSGKLRQFQSGFRRVAGMVLIGMATLHAHQVCADTTVTVAVSGTAHDALFSVAFDGDAGLAVGVGGSLLSTEDGGTSWTASRAPTKQALLGVAAKGQHALAVGQMGLALYRDGDGTWVEAETATEERLLAVAVNRHGTAVAVGGFGAILVSGDGGRSWREAAPAWDRLGEGGEMLGGGYGPTLYAAHVSEPGVITLAGEWGMVLRSADRGDSWSVLHIGDTAQQIRDATLFGMHVAGERIVAVGQEGMVLVSEDGGSAWWEAETASSANLLGITVAGSGRMFIAGMRAMLVSDDGGRTWSQVTGSDIAMGWYSGVAAPTRGLSAYAVGHSGRILRVGNAGTGGYR